jgi:hypothetical protein
MSHDPVFVVEDSPRIVAHPEQYLFWDTIHPTAAVHRILGDVASRLIDGVLGDVNTDGEVDEEDLGLWRAGFRTANAVRRQGDADGDHNVDGEDFLAWQRNVGANLSASPRPSTALAAPEPSSDALLVMAGVISVTGRFRLRNRWPGHLPPVAARWRHHLNDSV